MEAKNHPLGLLVRVAEDIRAWEKSACEPTAGTLDAAKKALWPARRAAHFDALEQIAVWIEARHYSGAPAATMRLRIGEIQAEMTAFPVRWVKAPSGLSLDWYGLRGAMERFAEYLLFLFYSLTRSDGSFTCGTAVEVWVTAEQIEKATAPEFGGLAMLSGDALRKAVQRGSIRHRKSGGKSNVYLLSSVVEYWPEYRVYLERALLPAQSVTVRDRAGHLSNTPLQR